MNAQREILSVCLAVVRGRLSPDQAREAILGRTSPASLTETLRLDPALVREAEQPARLPEKDRADVLELFKRLYDSTPPDQVIEEDRRFGRMLVEQGVLSQAQVDEGVAVQDRLHRAGCAPLPRLGELLLRKGFLVPGSSALAPAQPESARKTEIRGRPSPPEVEAALANPSERFGRYVRVSLLGEGGAGEVWKAWDTMLERWVALKFLKFEDTEELARLKREAQTAARLSHPNIAAVFEMGEANGRTFLVMELIEGQTLATYPRKDHRKLVSMMRDVALAIQYAHDKGVIHRDVKPGNIMVDSAGRPYIMDFGLARQIGSERSFGPYVLGTPSYMSPEQAMGKAVDARSDVYSLGATLYELLSDRPPFRGRNALDTLDRVVREEPPPQEGIAADLRTIVSACLMKEPARRYPKAADLAEDLRRWQEGEAIRVHPPSILYRLRKRIAKRKAVLIVGVGGLLFSAAVAGGLVRQLSVEKESRAAEARALSLARPYLEEGRRTRTRLDRLLMADDWTPEAVKALTDEAHREFDRALEHYPAYPDALLEKARIFNLEKDKIRALEYFTKAIEATSGYTSGYLSRARILLDQYEELRHASAETPELAARIRSDLKQVDEGSKDTKELLFASGAAALVGGEYEKAARVFEEYARESVSSARGWEWAGHAWLHVPGMHEKAVRDFTESIKIRTRTASVWALRGRAHLQGGGTAAAAADFRRALELEPSNVDAHLGLGEAQLRAGEIPAALSSFTQAVEAAPEAPAPRVARAWARLRVRDGEGALADAEEAIRLGSVDPAAVTARGRARLSAGDVGSAQADFEAVLAKRPRFAPAFVGLGDARRERGDPERAIAEYGKAIELDPGLAEAWHHRGNAERDRRNLEKAVLDLSKAIELDPVNPYLYFDRGVAFCNRGAWREAEAEFRKGLARDPSRPDWFWQRLWLARAKMGEGVPAREELAGFLRERSGPAPGRLAPKISDLLVEKYSEEEFLALLERGETSRKGIAEAYFFAGEKALLEGRAARAAELFKRCLSTGAVTAPGTSTAEVELRALNR